MKKSIQTPFWLITIGTLIVLVLPRLVQDGMFPDGVLYAAVAHNLATGKSSFWLPYFNETLFPFFHQQPPLTFGIQAQFFHLFGDSIYVERGYSFLTACITAALLILLWNRVEIEGLGLKRLSWLPMFYWITIPICFWSYGNNMEENTMGVFTLLSVLLIYTGLTKDRWSKVAYLIAGGLMTVPATLCKGFPGFFPLALPPLYYLIIRPVWYPRVRAVLLSLATILSPLFVYVILMQNNHINYSLNAYINERVINSIENVSNVNTRFYMIFRLFCIELLPLIIATALIFFLSGTRQLWKGSTGKELAKAAFLFFFLGICASFPLIVTKEQRGFYLVPSFPCFAMAFALVTAPGLFKLQQQLFASKAMKILRPASLAFIPAGLLYCFLIFGKTDRDKEQLHDVYAFGKLIPLGATVRVYPETWQDWTLQNYFVRHFNISLAQDTSGKYDYFIDEKDLHKPPPKIYTKLVAKGLNNNLYKKGN